MPIIIRKYNPTLLNTPGVIYCARKSQDLGLGNPFSHLKNSRAKFQVNTLEESLKEYRRWLWKLIKFFEGGQVQLESWEQLYLNRVVNLAKEIREGKVDTLVCFCVNKSNYNYDKYSVKQCHTEILYGACCYLQRKGDEIKLDK